MAGLQEFLRLDLLAQVPRIALGFADVGLDIQRPMRLAEAELAIAAAANEHR